MPPSRHVFAPLCTRNGFVDGSRSLHLRLSAPDGEESSRRAARLAVIWTSSFFVGESVVGHMKKPLFECTVLIAHCTGWFRPRRRAAKSPSTTNDPTHLGRERFPCKCSASESIRCSVVPRTNCETCVEELEPRTDCPCPPRSSVTRWETWAGGICCACVVACLLYVACALLPGVVYVMRVFKMSRKNTPMSQK